MLQKLTPEAIGIDSEKIVKYIEKLEKYNLSTHNLILAKGDKIFFEQYWKPFNKDFLHRMYSVSKSFVSIAIGFLEQDGLISLDDTIEKYFAEEFKNQTDINMKNQTIRHMLMMSTAKEDRYWFDDKPDDRVRYYFENDKPFSRHPSLIFQYDSSGSFVLGALVERVSKMELMDYLRIKLFDKIGVSKEAYCLKCPGGHSWGDSGILCTPLDLLKVARFVMNEGKWNGEQILNAEYIKKATSKQIDNNPFGHNDCQTQGYGYQIWRTYNNSYFFNGMGCQFAVCVPDKDMIMIYNGDNQGNNLAKEIIIGGFFDLIVNSAGNTAITNNDDNCLKNYCDSLELASAQGEKHSEFAEEINGAVYELEKNAMGIEKIRLEFEGETGKLHYTNVQGEKEISFGMCKNEYALFPEEGYSDNIGGEFVPGNFYRCAASAAWVGPQKLFIKVQIIDKYFGNLNITLGFKDNDITICMKKFAEDFLNEYDGFASGTIKKQI